MIRVAKYNDIYLVYGELKKYKTFDIHVSVHGKIAEILIMPDEENLEMIKVNIPELDINKIWLAYSQFTGRGTFVVFIVDHDKLNKIMEHNNIQFTVESKKLEYSYHLWYETEINYIEEKLKNLIEKYIIKMVDETITITTEREKRKMLIKIYDIIDKYGKYIHPIVLNRLINKVNRLEELWRD